jgi:hypothetical protein
VGTHTALACESAKGKALALTRCGGLGKVPDGALGMAQSILRWLCMVYVASLGEVEEEVVVEVAVHGNHHESSA